MNFNELKQKYAHIDVNPLDDSSMIVKNYIIQKKGNIYFSRCGYDNEGNYLSIYTNIAEKRTLEQIDMFLTAIL